MNLELLKIGTIVLILAGVLLGVGMTVITELADSTRSNELVRDEAVTFSAFSGNLANDHVTSIIGFANVTGEVNATSVTDVTAWLNFTAEGVLSGDARNFSNGGYVVTYYYDKASDTTTTVNNFNTGLGDFITWFSIIVVVIASAVVITIVTKNFR